MIIETELLKIYHNLLYQEIPVKLVSEISVDGSYRCIKIEHYIYNKRTTEKSGLKYNYVADNK